MVDRGSFAVYNNDLSFVDERVRAYIPQVEDRLLPRGFELSPWTVICGRGRECYNNGKNTQPF